MKKLLTSLYALVVGSLLTVGANAQPNLLVAGNFEGISSITTYWPATAGVWGAESSALSGAGNGITPFGSQMLQLNHAGGGTAGQTAQIIQGPFTAGSVVTFTAKFNTWLTGQSVRLDILPQPTGVTVDGPRVSSLTLALDSDTSTWQTVTATTTLTSATNYISAEIILSQSSNGALFGQPRAYVDDAVVTVVAPTPGTNWVNWTGTQVAGGITKYVGQIVVPRTGGGTTTVTVKYTPPNQLTDVHSPGTPGIAFIQTTNGTDFWAQGNSGSLGRNPARSPYTSAKVTSIPDGGGAASDKSDIIALRYAGTNTLEFTDSAGTPISIASPVFGYVSLNGNGYGFNQDFDILSFGDGIVRDQGYFGNGGTSSKSTAVAGQYRLLGTGEPHGTLQFRGSFSTVTWESLSNEFWNGFTIGVAQLADDVPIANAGPDQTVNATSPSGATVTLAGSASGSTKTPFTFTWSGAFGSVTGQSPTVTLPVGTHTITLDVRDTAGSTDSDTVVITVLPNPAPVITSAASAGGTYGAPFSYTITATNSPTSFGATNLPAGLTLTGAVISGTPTETGIFGVSLSATNSGGTGTKMLSLNIAKANATVVVTPYNVTFDGNPHSATVTITGVNGETGASVGTVTLSSPHTNAGIYSDSWSFNGGTKYNNIASTPITNTINKASATVTVTGYTGTYDGAAHGASGSATGVGGIDLSASLNLGATFTNVPGGTANWTFSGDANHNSASGTVAIVINKANAVVVVTPYNVTYNGQPHSATVASITGVNGENGATVGAVTLNTTHTNAGTYADSWSFAGTTNYNNIASTAVTNTIAKANAVVVVTPYNVTYNGQPHSATVASITGVNGETGATVGTVTLNTTHTNAGTYADSWSFAGTANYNNIASTAITNSIAKANAAVVVTPYNVTYNGQPHSATVASITGVNGETGATVGAVTLDTTHTNAGTYADSWSFAGTANYNNIASTAITNTIAKANAVVVVTPYNVAYNGQPHSATVASITGVNGETGATVGAVTLDTTHTNVGTYADSWTFAGAANYNNIASTAITNTITKASAVVVVTPYNVAYNGQPHSATVASITGVNGETGATVGAVTLDTTHTNAGTYADSWSFVGTANYNDIASTAITNTIAKANATVVVTPYSVTYNGQPHSATVASITGVNGETGATVGAVTLNTTHTSAGTYADSWSFAGTANYNHIVSTAVTNTIAKANAAVVVTPYNVTYNGQPHSATVAAITGVNGETGATVGAVTLNTTHTNAGTYADSWSFTGAANYNSIASTGITNTIAKATATVVVTPYSVTYNGQPHSATVASITGVNGETGATVGTVTLNTTHTNAGTYADSWSFAGAANYKNIASTAITNTIAKANATVVVTPYNVEYNAQPHSATVASITGVNGETGATVGSVTLNTTHTAVGIYNDSWSFTGAANYNNIAATPITNVIKDTTAPVISSLSTNAPTLWPPNHKMVAVTVSATATDLVGVTSLKIISATCNESDNGLGDGDTANDIQITGNLTLKLRAERSGTGNGRIYTITVEARDLAGNASTGTVTVSVPKSQGK